MGLARVEAVTIVEIITAIVALGGLITGFLSLWKARAEGRKFEAEAADLIQHAAAEMVKAQNIRIESLERQVCILNSALISRDDRIRELERQVAERDARISEMQAEIDTLRERLEMVEKRKRSA